MVEQVQKGGFSLGYEKDILMEHWATIVRDMFLLAGNEERKLAEQGTKFGSNSAQSPTHRRGSWRLCMLHHEQTTPRHPLIKPRHGHQLCLSTHMRRSPRICVDHQSLSPRASISTPRCALGSLGVAFTFSTKFRVHA
ncbi:hypothetical protein PIB30_096697 [Stylosanthes scabra]|uniref:Uncharacterized protein n=1 Tax=Stylosanthes scabra TaxID=79078 RepID=A0ABU6VW58_9FABA|nr:hypothetical protein [Stylosanthes scabra]